MADAPQSNSSFHSKLRRWAFTWNNYTEDNVNELKCLGPDKVNYLVFGFEICPSTGTKHLQGYVEFSCSLQGSTVKSRLDPIGKTKSPVSVRGADKVREANINYCKKSKTKDPERSPPWFEIVHKETKPGKRTDFERAHEFIQKNPNMSEFAEEFPEMAIKYRSGIQGLVTDVNRYISISRVKSAFENVNLRGWQKELWGTLIVRCPINDRKIIWVYDRTGGCGKTWFTKYCLVNIKNVITLQNAPTRDIATAIAGCGEPPEVVIFDYCRSMEGVLNYEVLESIKNGMIFVRKYNSMSYTFPTPHVVCFANFPPQREMLSQDRWDVRNLETSSNDSSMPIFSSEDSTASDNIL